MPALAQTAPIQPILRLEKPKYVLGESIRFWVGLEANTPDQRLPAEIVEARKPCALGITDPAGAKETRSVGWPMDGDASRGWLGGWGFDAKIPGDYLLSLECEGVSSPEVKLPVEKNDILKKIKITFQFKKSGTVPRLTPVPVIFDVRNESNYTIRFPERGALLTEGIALHVVRRDPVEVRDLNYPMQKLSKTTAPAVAYTWSVAPKIRTVTLVPGGHLQQRLWLDDCFKFDKPGKYVVTISTVVSTLVGDRDGRFKDFSPIRIPAQQTAEFAVSGDH